jgi:uncharacterized protein YjiS (DUF1127 family)
MTDTPTLGLAAYQGAHAKQRGGPAARSQGRAILRPLRRLLARWRARDRFHSELEQKLRGDPHLIDDVGLSRRQVQEELDRPFWQVL